MGESKENSSFFWYSVSTKNYQNTLLQLLLPLIWSTPPTNYTKTLDIIYMKQIQNSDGGEEKEDWLGTSGLEK